MTGPMAQILMNVVYAQPESTVKGKVIGYGQETVLLASSVSVVLAQGPPVMG